MDSQLITRRVRRILLASTGLMLTGSLLSYYFPIFIDNTLRDQLQIQEEGNDFTRAWSHNPFPLYMSVYVFGLENADEFGDGAKARLREYGPYVYE